MGSISRRKDRLHSGKSGEGDIPSPTYGESEGKNMFTISNILEDIDRGCAANNMIEDKFSYRVVYFVRDSNGSFKHYIDTAYEGLRETLEGIVKENLSLTNSVVIAAVTVRKDGQSICLQSRSYGFSLDEYFRQINGECGDGGRRGYYNRYAVG